MINRFLPILAIVLSILSLILIKLSYSSWLVNDGVQTNISKIYAKVIQIFSSSVVDEEVSFISGNGFTEDKAIFITLGLAIALSVLSVVIGLISIYLKKHRQLSAIATSLGILGFGLIMFAVK